MTPDETLAELLSLAGLPATDCSIHGDDPVILSRFRVAAASSAALAATGAAADAIWQLAGHDAQKVTVNATGAGLSLTSFLFQRLETGELPLRDPNRPLVQFHQAGDGRWIHLHGAFPALAEGTLRVLDCADDAESISRAVTQWNAADLEDALAEAGMCGAMARTRAEWLAHEQGRALEDEPPLRVTRIGDSDPVPISAKARPLEGTRVLDLTRVLAGPTCGRTLAAHGARVLKVNSPNLPSVPPFVLDTGHGKRSTWLDLKAADDHAKLISLLETADVFSQGYRLGAMDKLGLSPEQLAEARPGIIYVSINAYGHKGPWAGRPGWEQLAQTATGVAVDEGSFEKPRLISAAATDYTTGYLAAVGAMAALYRRAREGGSYHVQVSLSQTANWLYHLGLFDEAQAPDTPPDAQPFMTVSETGYGRLHHLGPILQMSDTPPRWEQPTVPLGTHEPAWW